MRKLRTIEKDIRRVRESLDYCMKKGARFEAKTMRAELKALKAEYRAACKAAQLWLPGFKEMGGVNHASLRFN